MKALYATLYDIKLANIASGGFWFERKTMRFFNSRLHGGVIGGRFFITSEQQDSTYPRLYSVRMAHADGDVSTCGKFQAYQSVVEARAAARRYATLNNFFGNGE